MNERIRELAEQAENYAHEQNDKFGLSYKREYNKKFAELITQDCSEIVRSVFREGDVDLGYDAVHVLQERIQELGK